MTTQLPDKESSAAPPATQQHGSSSNGGGGSGSGNTKPTILWIHGSWHTPAHFAPIIELATKAGYVSECPRQPSVGNKPPLGMVDDAACIRDTLVRLVEQEGREVLVVAHSYGGMLANEGIGPRFARRDRAAKGLPGGVLRIVFMCAFLVGQGQPLVGPLGGSLPPFIPVDDDEMCHMINPEQMFYNDMPPEEQARWVAQLLKSPASTQLTPLTQVVYTAHPITYLHGTEDAGLTYPIQQRMTQAIGEQYGVTFATEVLPSGHSPFLSMPDKTLAAIERHTGTTAAA